MATDNAQDNDLKQLQDKIAELEEARKRVLADYRNLERQSREERVQQREQACRELVLDLLPTLDHLNLAVDHKPDPVLGMILTDLQRVLAEHGLERVWARNKPFDPQTMEAAGVAPGEKDVAVREEHAGYALNGKIIRPARVLVGTGEKTNVGKKD